MDKNIERILSNMKSHGISSFAYSPLTDMAELLSIIAEQQTQAADKMEKKTDMLVAMTRILVVLTFGLLAYTAILCFITVKVV